MKIACESDLFEGAVGKVADNGLSLGEVEFVALDQGRRMGRGVFVVLFGFFFA